MDKKQKRIKQVRMQIFLLVSGIILFFVFTVFFFFGGTEKKKEEPKEVAKVQFVETHESHYSDDDEYEINEECEAYRSQVKKIAKQYDMKEYVDLIMALMMQESGGRGLDVLQSSEGAFNEYYPRVPNGITDTTYSIECGIQELKAALEKAEVTGPRDITRIRQALQAYNFGIYYLDFSKERGVEEWEEETVAAYAEMASGGATRSEDLAELMGVWDYGDQMYPDHVLRYYKYKSGHPKK